MKKIFFYVIVFAVLFSLWAIFFAEDKYTGDEYVPLDQELNTIQENIDASMKDVAYTIYTNKDYHLCNPLVKYSVAESSDVFINLVPGKDDMQVYSIIDGIVNDISTDDSTGNKYVTIDGTSYGTSLVTRTTLLINGSFTVVEGDVVKKCDVLGVTQGKIKVEVYENNLFIFIDPNLVINK